MDEHDISAVQADPSIGVGPWRSIFEITFYDTTHMGELASDLVVSSGEQVDF